MKRNRYNYIPKEEIESIQTWEGKTVESEDILDGAYTRKARPVKKANGGKVKATQILETEGAERYIHIDTPRAVNSLKVKKAVQTVVNEGIPSKDLHLKMGFVANDKVTKKVAADFQKVKNHAYFNSKMARGGVTREKSVSEQAEELVGYNVWNTLDSVEKEDLVGELYANGALSVHLADGGDVDPDGETIIRTQFEEEDFEYADGGEVKKYLFNFENGGWNSVHAKSKREAIKLAKKLYNDDKLKVNEKSFRPYTEKDERNEMRSFYADGGKVLVGKFNEKQLRDGEDKKAIEKKMKETGLKYIDNKIIKKNGKPHIMEVYLYADGGMAKGGRIDEMVKSWEKSKTAYSNINKDDTEFFERIKLSPMKVGTSSDTGNDIFYYDTEFYNDYKDAKRGNYKSQMADGGVATQATDFAVTYNIKGSKDKKEKLFKDNKKAQTFFQMMSEEDDVENIELKEVGWFDADKAVAVAPKPNLFKSMAKPVPVKSTAAKKQYQEVRVSGIEDNIAEYEELKAVIDNAKARTETLRGEILEVGLDKFIELYERDRRNPNTFKLADGSKTIMVMPTDAYIGDKSTLSPEKVAMLEQFEGLVSVDTTYSFDKDVLERVGDVVSRIIMDSKLLSDEDKANLILQKTTYRIRKGTIDRLLDYDNPREILDLVQPIFSLK